MRLNCLPHLGPLGVFLLSVVFFGGCAGSDTQNSATTPAERPLMSPGESIFQLNCAQCHSVEGDSRSMAQLVPGSAHFSSAESFTTFLRQPTSPMMNPYSEAELPDADAALLYGWLKQRFHSQPAQK